MRAALLREIGGRPEPGEADEPVRGPGQALVAVTAAPINPIDVATAAGRFYGGAPEVPYVPGREAVGTVLEGERFAVGTRVYVGAGGGCLAERVAVDEERLVEVPEGPDDAHAACYGIAGLAAWLPLEWRAELRPGETVLVLGASGPVGAIAVQAARLLGAGRVVAAARSADGLARARELGADAVVDLKAGGDLAAAFREAARGEVDVTIDPVWGAPAAAALAASGPWARLVQIGQSADAQATLPSADIRGRPLSILGHTNFAAPAEVRAAAYRRMVEHAAAGELVADHEVLALAQVGEAWRRQETFPRRKLVLRP